MPWPPPVSPLWLNSPWATASPESGAAEFRAVQAGGCYNNWPFENLNCASCQWCPRGPMPAGYPFGGVDPTRNRGARLPPAVPASGSFAYNVGGGLKPYNRDCMVGPRDWLAPTGARSVKIAEPDVWTVLPNQVPPSVAINWFNMPRYIDDIYANRRGKLFQGCTPGAAGQCACSNGVNNNNNVNQSR